MSAVLERGQLLARARGVSFYAAPASVLREEADALVTKHWLEAGFEEAPPPIANRATYENMEQLGRAACVVVREDATGRLVGYATFFFYPHHHDGTLVADGDLFYLAPQWRRGWLGVKLLRVMEALLRARGVEEIRAGYRLHVKPGRGRQDLARLFFYLGYHPAEVIMRKRLVP